MVALGVARNHEYMLQVGVLFWAMLIYDEAFRKGSDGGGQGYRIILDDLYVPFTVARGGSLAGIAQ